MDGRVLVQPCVCKFHALGKRGCSVKRWFMGYLLQPSPYIICLESCVASPRSMCLNQQLPTSPPDVGHRAAENASIMT